MKSGPDQSGSLVPPSGLHEVAFEVSLIKPE